jgi:hypothetical protein
MPPPLEAQSPSDVSMDLNFINTSPPMQVKTYKNSLELGG